MRSVPVVANENIYAQQFTNLRHDAYGAGRFLAYQQVGSIALPTNPTNNQTLTLDINGTNVVITFVSSIGAAAGNVLIGATAAATLANLIALLNQPQTSTTTGVAFSSANQTLISYLNFALSGTTVTPGSNNISIYAPLTSFSASTTVTGGSYTANTLALYVGHGVGYIGASATRVIFAGGPTPTMTAPVSNPRIDLITVDNTGTIAVVTGTENASPTAPAYPSNKIVLCEIFHVVGETAIYDALNQTSGQGYILNDVRPFQAQPFITSAIPEALIPDGDGTRDLGTALLEWGTLYVKNNILLNGQSINAATLLSLTAGENVTAGQPGVVLPTPTSDILLDNKASGSGTGSTITSSNFAVGNNSNRKVVVLAWTTANNASFGVSGMTFGGSSMTQSQAGGSNGSNNKGYVFFLDSPTVSSTDQLVISTNNASCSVEYLIYSYYNAKSGALPSSGVQNESSTANYNITSTMNGSLILSGASQSGSTSITGTPANNQLTPSGFQAGDTGPIYPPQASAVAWVFNGSGSGGGTFLYAEIQPVYTGVKAYKAGSALAVLCAAFIGFFQSSVSSGASVSIATSGVDGNQSGLIPATQYYLNDTRGTIGTSAGTVTRKVGISVAATQIAVTNIW